VVQEGYAKAAKACKRATQATLLGLLHILRNAKGMQKPQAQPRKTPFCMLLQLLHTQIDCPSAKVISRGGGWDMQKLQKVSTAKRGRLVWNANVVLQRKSVGA
jgi:hypothetical protein